MTEYISNRLDQRWFFWYGLLFSAFISLPFLAPVLMNAGLGQLAAPIYRIYSFLCHQMPQRSFFLFGEQAMYPLIEIQNVWGNSNNPLVLRRFLGNPEMGWKVAWSDRMVYMYSSVFISSLLWYPIRRKIREFPFWAFLLSLLPMAIDGTTHMLSDFSGIGQGIRDSNLWLAALTNHQLSPGFYAGDAFGSFNSWMRLISGVSFGIGIVLFGFPYVEEIFEDNLARQKFQHERLFQLKEEALHKIDEFRKGIKE
jgi:uncharacterized membrane protein